MQIETRISGIPCLVDYSIHGHYEPARTYGPPERCYEAQYPEIDFDVLDRRGRPAPWLEKKLTQAERQRIETEIEEAHEDDQDY